MMENIHEYPLLFVEDYDNVHHEIIDIIANHEASLCSRDDCDEDEEDEVEERDADEDQPPPPQEERPTAIGQGWGRLRLRNTRT